MRGFTSVREQIRALNSLGQLKIISAPVDAHLEIAEIHRRIVAQQGPALLFENVRGSPFPVLTNALGTTQRAQLALGAPPEDILAPLLKIAHRGQLPKLKELWQARSWLLAATRGGLRHRARAPVAECCLDPADLTKLPMLTSWPMDGGAFLTLPLVYTQSPDDGRSNLGMYRMQRFDAETGGLHMQIGKGGGFHLWRAEQLGQSLPISIFLGGPPALTFGAVAPLPENVSELLFASWLMQGPIDIAKDPRAPHPLIANCEFALVGRAQCGERKLEGPFGDHYGYYSLAHPFPLFRCERIFHRKGAILPATVVGCPPQEDLFIGEYLQEMISPLIPLVMPGVKALWSYPAGGFHSVATAIVQERYEREALAHAFRILGEGQLSLTKCLFLLDDTVEIRSFRKALEHLLRRFSPETDCYVFPNLSMDTLDYAGPKLNRGSKVVFVGTGAPRRELPTRFYENLPAPIDQAKPFCPGCLVLSTSVNKHLTLAEILIHPSLANWPLLFLVDDVESALKSEASLIWSVFTRFDPAADLHAGKTSRHGNHLMRKGPLLIDARSKASYPPIVEVDDQTARKVSSRWSEYFY